MTGPTSFNAFSSGSPAGGQPTNPTLTPQAIERRQALAAALMKEGSDYSPIQSPWQGVARVAAAISGGLQQHWADEDYSNSLAASAKRNSDLLSQIWGAGGGYSPGTGASAVSGGTPVASNTGDIGVNLPADGLQKRAYDFFVNKGYTPAAAAGLVGNFQQESGFSPGNIASVSGGGDGGMSKHLAQWNGDRLTGLQNYAAQQGKSPSDFDTQLGYVDWELNNTEKATGDALKGVTDPGQAAYIAAGYERPQGWKQGGSAALINGWKNRLAYSQQAYNQWGNGGQVAQAAPPQQAPSNQVASADPGFVPQMPQTAPQQAIPLPPIDPRTQQANAPQPMTGANSAPQMAAMGLQPLPVANGAPLPPQGQQFAPNSLTGAQAEQLANQGQIVPMSAVQNPPDTPDSAPAGAQPMTAANSAPEMAGMGLKPMDVANGGPLPPQAASPGAQAVTNAMVAPGAPPAASAQPNLTDGGQKVAQALAPAAPIAQPGVPANVLGAYAQMMADPWTAPEVKQQMGAMLASRMRPVDYGFQTLPDGTIVRTDPRNGTVTPIYQGPSKPIAVGNNLVDPRTMQPVFKAPNYQKVTGLDGAEHVYDMNDPKQAALANGSANQQGAGVNAFPGQPLTNEMKDYNAVVAQAKAAGQQPPTYQQYQMDLKKQGAQSVVITGEGAEAKTAGEAAGTRRANMLAAADAAPGTMSRIQLLRNVLQQTKTGPLAGVLGQAGGLANALGISGDTLKELGIDPNQAVDNQIAEKMSNKMVTESIGAGKGIPASNFSIAERQFIEKMYPNIANQPGSNEAVSDVLMAEQQHALDMADGWSKFKDDARSKGQTPSFEDFEDQWRQQHGKDNIFQPIIDKFNAGGYSNLGTQAPGIGPQTNDQAGAKAPPANNAGAPAGYPNARKAPNGNWYVPNPAYKNDPTQPQWFQVVQ